MVPVHTSKTHNSPQKSSSARKNWDRRVISISFYLEGFTVFELLLSFNTLHLTTNMCVSEIPVWGATAQL